MHRGHSRTQQDCVLAFAMAHRHHAISRLHLVNRRESGSLVVVAPAQTDAIPAIENCFRTDLAGEPTS
jgi:hypothetical protein